MGDPGGVLSSLVERLLVQTLFRVSYPRGGEGNPGWTDDVLGYKRDERSTVTISRPQGLGTQHLTIVRHRIILGVACRPTLVTRSFVMVGSRWRTV